MNEILLDVSELAAPYPLIEATKALKQIDKDSYIKLIHRMNPCLLFDMLDNNGFAYKKFECEDGGVTIYIWQSSGQPPQNMEP